MWFIYLLTEGLTETFGIFGSVVVVGHGSHKISSLAGVGFEIVACVEGGVISKSIK
jgi:hypothetical protein